MYHYLYLLVEGPLSYVHICKRQAADCCSASPFDPLESIESRVYHADRRLIRALNNTHRQHDMERDGAAITQGMAGEIYLLGPRF